MKVSGLPCGPSADAMHGLQDIYFGFPEALSLTSSFFPLILHSSCSEDLRLPDK